ncbi:hypothetical protein MMH89_01385 [Candidatus Comchoanobacter bicostacola]|uniref:Uncharacterized protein n=1 Tax=Candidatus Comchoanobacter bicostacola TaxID=2919598 RepID=A0ABY5DLW6_9GAMM|nr:hypothetical protein [Candidatus Comchoanobacter bicostacola]UTC24804.1 hypothetical protein MMH89_01385 [Candidatus Comchoanobacter bicostacola]
MSLLENLISWFYRLIGSSQAKQPNAQDQAWYEVKSTTSSEMGQTDSGGTLAERANDASSTVEQNITDEELLALIEQDGVTPGELEELEALLAQGEEQAQEVFRQAEEAAQHQATIGEVLARPIGDKSTPTDEELEAELEELIAEQDRNDSQSDPSP